MTEPQGFREPALCEAPTDPAERFCVAAWPSPERHSAVASFATVSPTLLAKAARTAVRMRRKR
jgi:hypothetical protein